MATTENALMLTSGAAVNKFSILENSISNVIEMTKLMSAEFSRPMAIDSIKTVDMELMEITDSFGELQSEVEASFVGIDNSIESAADRLKDFREKSSGIIEVSDYEIIPEKKKSEETKKKSSVSKIDKIKDIAGKVKNNVWPMVEKGMEMTDKYTRQEIDLSSIAGENEPVDSLRQKVYSAAQNSRSGYDGTLSTVTKLAKTSKDDFKSNDEIIYFTELMNKAFSGLGADEAAQSIEKVTEAMAKGHLEGNELNELMAQSPMLTQALTSYTGQSQEQLVTGDGVSDDVIRNAMFNSADAINQKFGEMPVTFAQIGTSIKDTLYNSFAPVLEMISNGATWVYKNWSTLEPIFWGLAAAVAVYAAYLGIMAIATTIQTIAQDGLNLSLLFSPITVIALAIGLIIGLIVKWIQSVGGLKVAWLMVMNALLTAWDLVKISFFTGVYGVVDMWNYLKFGIKTANTGILNFIGDMKSGALTLLQGMVNGAIDIINKFINVLNKITGGSIETVAHVTFGTEAKLKNDAEKRAREMELEEERKKLVATKTEHQKEIAAKMLQADSDQRERVNQFTDLKAGAAEKAKEKDIANKYPVIPYSGNVISDGPNSTDIAEKAKEKDAANKYSAASYNGNGISNDVNSTNLAATAANTGAMKNTMDITEENLVYMRDVAERDAINKFTTSEISVQMGGITNNVNSELDLDGVVSYMEQKVYETMSVAAEGGHY